MKRSIPLFSILILFLIGCKNNQEVENVKQSPLTLCVPQTTDKSWYQSDNIAPIIEGLDVLNHPITTSNELAQKYFNQGLVLAYGFNHAEAARSFYYATKLDPSCAMAYWGFAYVLGPNYNGGMEADNYQRAFDAIQNATLHSSKATPKEKAMINALTKRYVKEEVEDRSHLDMAYSKAMKQVFEDYPADADVGAIYAESLMDLHPWDLWDKNGNIKEWTPEILETLDKVFSIDPKHIGAHHFYIHAVEASREPQKGLKSAKIFDDGLVPGAGHLVHMPAHIYIRTGDYHKGSVSNVQSIIVDSNYVSACNAQGAYPLAYFPHNYHFLAATATLEGNSKWALHAADKVSEHVNTPLMKEPGWGTLQHYYTIPYYVYAKFGKWDKILMMEENEVDLKYPEAVRHYARGMAYLGKDDISKAKNELIILEEYAEDESLKELTIWEINSVYTLMEIATRVLKAEILARESNFNESIALLKEAVEIEDALNYNEPPDWFFSVRHHLGSIEIEAGKYQEAIQTFEEDLVRLPKNGWALHGMMLAYEKLNNSAEVTNIENLLKEIWATADVDLSSARVEF